MTGTERQIREELDDLRVTATVAISELEDLESRRDECAERLTEALRAIDERLAALQHSS